MLKLKTRVLLLALLSLIAVTTPSCLTTKTDVGNYAQSDGTPYKYAKGKQVWLFWGLIPVGRTKVNTPDDGNCQVVTRFNGLDVLISAVTGGIVTTYTIRVNAKQKQQ